MERRPCSSSPLRSLAAFRPSASPTALACTRTSPSTIRRSTPLPCAREGTVAWRSHSTASPTPVSSGMRGAATTRWTSVVFQHRPRHPLTKSLFQYHRWHAINHRLLRHQVTSSLSLSNRMLCQTSFTCAAHGASRKHSDRVFQFRALTSPATRSFARAFNCGCQCVYA